jgi:hypothetical protein
MQNIDNLLIQRYLIQTLKMIKVLKNYKAKFKNPKQRREDYLEKNKKSQESNLDKNIL